MNLADLPTPCLVVDRAKLSANTSAMAARASAAGVRLRPHVKTSKSAEVTELATAGHFGGITASTLAEVAYFIEHDYRDITYAVCIAPHKLAAVHELQRRSATIGLITDDEATIRDVADRAAKLGGWFRVMVEIDSGEHRTGVHCDSDELLAIAAAIDAAPRLELAGVLTHGGHSYECTSTAAVAAVAEQERASVVRAAQRLRSAGLPCPTVSAGSTPTAVHAKSFEGLTEIRPGVYVFFDLAQHGRGSCELNDIAMTVLATVISHRPEHGRLIVDAGGLALSKDTSASAFFTDAGYGWVLDANSGDRIADLRVAGADQEHGFVEGAIPFDTLPIGSRVRIAPNHACMTAAAYDRYYVVDGSRGVVDRWHRVNGW